MSLIVPDSFAIGLLNFITLQDDDVQSIKEGAVRLYQNDYTPTRSSTAGDFTQASFTGYAAGTIEEGNWTPSVLVSGTPQTTYDNSPGFTFTCASGSGQLIYGYYVQRNGSDPQPLWFAERFDTPRLIAPGVPLVLLINFTLKSQYPET